MGSTILHVHRQIRFLERLVLRLQIGTYSFLDSQIAVIEVMLINSFILIMNVKCPASSSQEPLFGRDSSISLIRIRMNMVNLYGVYSLDHDHALHIVASTRRESLHIDVQVAY